MDKIVKQLFQTIENTNFNKQAFDNDTFDSLINQLDKGNLNVTLTECGGLISAGCTDIRIITLYLYSSMFWMSDEVVSLLPMLHALVSDHFDLLLPEEMTKEEKLSELDLTLGWFFGKINRKLSFYQEKNSPEYSDWIAQFDLVLLNKIVDQGKVFRELISQLLAETKLQSLNEIMLFNQAFSGISPTEPSELPECDLLEIDVPEMTPDNPSKGQTLQQMSVLPQTSDTLDSVSDMGVANLGNASYELTLLLKKLDYFQNMVNRGNYIKASIIASDISQIMGQFDPRVYFPELFTPFLTTQIHHGQAIQEAMYQTDQTKIQPFIDLYNGDLEAFMEI